MGRLVIFGPHDAQGANDRYGGECKKSALGVVEVLAARPLSGLLLIEVNDRRWVGRRRAAFCIMRATAADHTVPRAHSLT